MIGTWQYVSSEPVEGGMIGWSLMALLTQFRSYRAFTVKTIL